MQEKSHKQEPSNLPEQSDESDAPNSDESPPHIERSTQRRLTILATGVVLALVLVVIIMNLGSPQVRPENASRNEDRQPIELIEPDALTEEQLAGTADVSELSVDDLAVQGGWIQVTDDHGQLAQQYRFERLDPNPEKGPGWAELIEPEAEVFLSDNRVVLLTGDRALAYTPSRALESGSIFGHVTIHLYELDERRSVNRDTDRPALTVTTDEARFDSMLGEIYCPGSVDIKSAHLDMPGNELRVLLNDQQQQIALRMASVRHILVRDGSFMRDEDKSDASDRGDAPRPQPSAVDPANVYRVSMTGNLRIEQQTRRGSRTITGDSLIALLTSESADLGESLAQAVVKSRRHRVAQSSGAATAVTYVQFLRATVVGVQDAGISPAPGETLIRFDGPLLVEPWQAEVGESLPLEHAEDAHVTMTGSPLRMTDSSESADAAASSLVYQRAVDSLALFGGEESPLIVSSPDLTATGEQFVYTRSDGRARFIGSGWLAPEQLDLLQDDQGARNVGDLIAELQITWQTGVDLQFASDGSDDSMGSLREVRFTGDVQVQSEDGDIFSDDLRLLLTLDRTGKPIPEQMIAAGGVKTTDNLRTMWADHLVVDFDEVDDGVQPRVNEAGSISARVSDDTMIRNLHAAGDVQVLLSDGSRAFADELIGDGNTETLELRGEHVVVAAGRMLIDRGKSITFDGKQQTGHWNGPGQLFVYDRAIDTSADERIDRPAINHDETPPNVKARWNESMDLDGAANDGAGEVTLDGDVFAESRPSDFEYNRLEGQQITLAFRATNADALPAEESDDPLMSRVSNRQLERFIARGRAKLENRLWRTADQSDKPRVFYVAGPLLEYNDIAFEARVLGAGELLFQDVFVDPDAPIDRADADDPLAGAFRGKGTSLFRWRDDLKMLARPGGEDGEHVISLRGDVTAIHRNLANETATLTGESVDAYVSRVLPTETDSTRPDAPARTTNFDLGGSFDLTRITGEGALAIQASRHTVTCDAFDYDLASGIAEARATDGRLVSVLTSDSAQPLRVGSILWDMARDVITVRRASGGG